MHLFRLFLTLLIVSGCFDASAQESWFFSDTDYAKNGIGTSASFQGGSSYSPSNVLTEGFASIAFGKTIGVDESYASLGLWIGGMGDEALYFLDARWHHLCNGENGANAGLGVRFGDDCRGCGANVYYDWRRYKTKDFQQLSAGIEGWISPWEFRLNVSMPLESFSILERSTIDYLEGYQFTSVESAYTCKVVSFLAGREFDLGGCWCPSFKCVALAGSYWISNKEQENCYGGIASLDFKLYQMFSLKTTYTYDEIFDSRVEAILAINIPFGCFEETLCSCFSSFFTRRPDRFELIPVTTKTHCSYNWNSP